MVGVVLHHCRALKRNLPESVTDRLNLQQVETLEQIREMMQSETATPAKDQSASTPQARKRARSHTPPSTRTRDLAKAMDSVFELDDVFGFPTGDLDVFNDSPTVPPLLVSRAVNLFIFNDAKRTRNYKTLKPCFLHKSNSNTLFSVRRNQF